MSSLALRAVRTDLFVTVASYAVLGVAFYLLYKKAQATGALDPTNPNNLAYSQVNSIGAKLTGDPNFSFGTWLYDATHPNEPNLAAPTPGPVMKDVNPPFTGGGGNMGTGASGGW